MVRIALISDIHFGKFSRTEEFSVPGEPLQDTNTGGKSMKESMISILKNQNVQYICIPGDLTSMGSPQEFLFCRDMLLNLAQNLNIPKDNIFIGLGNHDTDWKIASLYENYAFSNPDFPKEIVKEQYRRIAASAPLISLESLSSPTIKGPAPYSGIIEKDEFVIFILNTGWYCTKDQLISHGKLDMSQLSWFKEQSSKYCSKQKWKIILMHHHPFNYSYPIPDWDISTLEEGSEFLETIAENHFHLILHGHRHHPRAETKVLSQCSYPITFVCAGSLSVNANHRSGGSVPNTLHIIELTDEIGVLKLLTYEYSSPQGWIPLRNNCPETPLDSSMLLGKVFSPSNIEESIQKLISVGGEATWESLDECLKFMTFDKLNKQIRSQLDNLHKMVGNFPEDVYFLPIEK